MTTHVVATVVGGMLKPDQSLQLAEHTRVNLTIEPIEVLTSPAPAWESLMALKDGWNSYSAPAPSAVAIDNAKAFVLEADKQAVAPERVEPSAIGGVGVTFALGPREVVIEFYNKGTAHALFSDDATNDLRTKAVPTDREGFLAVLDEVRKHFYGK